MDKPISDRPPFERFAPIDVLDLIAEYPLAWIVAESAPPSLLPLIPETGSDGWPVALIGHMARRNPLVVALEAHASARILITGPQGYVSPAMVTEPDWGPTWNYAQLHIEADIRFEPGRSGAALAELLAEMERVAPTGWTPDMLGDRYRPMENAIIAFRADIRSLSGRFKLGQDEAPERLVEIIGRHPDPALVRWMERFNADRLSTARR